MAKKKTKQVDWRVICMGLLCITVLECLALSMGINGTLLKSVLVIIAITIGIGIPTPKFIKM